MLNRFVNETTTPQIKKGGIMRAIGDKIMLNEGFKTSAPTYYQRYGGRIYTVVEAHPEYCVATHQGIRYKFTSSDIEPLDKIG